jgi:hypothetical protein
LRYVSLYGPGVDNYWNSMNGMPFGDHMSEKSMVRMTSGTDYERKVGIATGTAAAAVP